MAVTFTPITVLAAIFAYQSYQSARESIEEQAKEQLVSILEIKKQQVEQYFETIHDQVVSYADNRMIINAMRDFKHAYKNYTKELEVNDVEQLKAELLKYYREDYNVEYKRRNSGEERLLESQFQLLDIESIALQYAFIKANEFSTGQKDELINLNNNTSYGTVHAKYHPHIREFLKRFGYYDIFLVDYETGDIVYSVFKELDYTTSLIDGPYADSAIAVAFQKVVNDPQGSVYLTDFSSYVPSYDDPAAFIATPIYDDNNKIGVLIFQMPVDKVNLIMTHGRLWRKSGLGETGETYLVGSDFTMRSISRFLIETPGKYEQGLINAGVERNTVAKILAKNTSIGLQPVTTPGATLALTGERGYKVLEDYRGVPVLSAFSPVFISGLKWAILSEIDEAEAFKKVYSFRSHIIKVSLFFVGCFSLVIFLISWFIAKYIVFSVMDNTQGQP
ncbi:cache domain-containing protein [Endozoicomonas sp. SM1973]|uniref:Cache domain-containing protein n=1 Tax=Spartinivicinus marinus TaxID=2994442 RepID=A0A853IA51_9GAMM|nr:cache domain-containing protein [Spartinivicinus marinus]MCX4027397.1 cache domain-containing protein [Spartinivicinus marinus]NYZ66427.1 cache domain-containing protein [Spartinivicinus marinus]